MRYQTRNIAGKILPMAEFIYPSRDIDRPSLLLSYLGSHWQSIYRGRGSQQIRTITASRGRAGNQSALDLQEAVAAVSRLTVPVWHTDQWRQLVIKESDLNSELVATPHYGMDARPGDPIVYGNDPVTGVELKYGRPLNFYSAFPLDGNIKDIPYISNRITSPSLTLVKNLDYLLAAGIITFRQNPFDNPLVAVREIYAGGVVVDREALLWLFRTQLEVEDIYRQHGYVINLHLPSSDVYRDMVNAVRDGVSEGGASSQLGDAFAALCDTPIVKTDGEVVEYVIFDERHLLVITDKWTYKYPLNALVIVAVGDVVNAGDQLVDTVEFIEFHDGTVPSDLAALEVDRGLLAGGYLGGITWHNKEVSVIVDESGIFTRVEWELGGWPGDIEKFWDDFNENGVLNPPTLAQLLDQRTNKSGEPTAGALPSTINPLEFLAENVLRNHAFVVKVKLARCGPDALGIENTRQLRRIIPPHTHMIVIVELAVDNETITMDGPGDELTPGFEEAPILGPGLEPITESIDGSTMITGTPLLSYTAGQCI